MSGLVPFNQLLSTVKLPVEYPALKLERLRLSWEEAELVVELCGEDEKIAIYFLISVRLCSSQARSLPPHQWP